MIYIAEYEAYPSIKEVVSIIPKVAAFRVIHPVLVFPGFGTVLHP